MLQSPLVHVMACFLVLFIHGTIRLDCSLNTSAESKQSALALQMIGPGAARQTAPASQAVEGSTPLSCHS